MKTEMPSEVFQRRMREERERRGISQRDMVQRLADLGHPMAQPAITRIESGKRKVSLDEAVLIAVALDMAPEQLYAPGPTWRDYLVEQAERSPREAAEAWHDEQVHRAESDADNPRRED